jgi:hypothetical protein
MTARLRRKAASDYLFEKHGIERAPTTLAKLASAGGGPVFSHVGNVPVYSPSDLDDWAQSLISGPVRLASERRAARAQPPERADAQVASEQEAPRWTMVNLAPEAASKVEIVEADPELEATLAAVVDQIR